MGWTFAKGGGAPARRQGMEPVSEAVARTGSAWRTSGFSMIDVTFTPDEIGPWSEIKLEIIQKYGPAYTKAFAGAKGRKLKRYYVDGFSGAGLHISKKGKHVIEGSP